MVLFKFLVMIFCEQAMMLCNKPTTIAISSACVSQCS